MAEVIPFEPGLAQQQVNTTLSDYPLIARARWNSRDAAWYLDLLEVDNTPIAYGLKLCLGVKIGQRLIHPLFRHGQNSVDTRPAIIMLDLSNTGKEATLDDFGSRVLPLYLDEGDMFVAQFPPVSNKGMTSR